MKINPISYTPFRSGIIKNVPVVDNGSTTGITNFDIDTAEIYKIKGREIRVGDGLFSFEIAEDPAKFVALYNALEKVHKEGAYVDYYGREINV